MYDHTRHASWWFTDHTVKNDHHQQQQLSCSRSRQQQQMNQETDDAGRPAACCMLAPMRFRHVAIIFKLWILLSRREVCASPVNWCWLCSCLFACLQITLNPPAVLDDTRIKTLSPRTLSKSQTLDTIAIKHRRKAILTLPVASCISSKLSVVLFRFHAWSTKARQRKPLTLQVQIATAVGMQCYFHVLRASCCMHDHLLDQRARYASAMSPADRSLWFFIQIKDTCPVPAMILAYVDRSALQLAVPSIWLGRTAFKIWN